ncbi:MAG: cytochrome c biogenesis protein ResB, partial [Desulfobacterium sp.]
MGNISRPGGAAGHVWDFFVSVKLTVATLAMLAFTSIFGTLIPQNQHAADYINAYGAFFFRFFDVFDLFNMYNSWWYRILIITLAGNILVCSLSRLSGTLAMVLKKKPAFKPLAIRQKLSSERPVGDIKDAVEKKLSKIFKK